MCQQFLAPQVQGRYSQGNELALVRSLQNGRIPNKRKGIKDSILCIKSCMLRRYGKEYGEYVEVLPGLNLVQRLDQVLCGNNFAGDGQCYVHATCSGE